MNLAVPISLTIALAVAAIAAVWDWRKGEIPNWLTLPPLVGAPLAYGFTMGGQYAITSALAILACGIVPYFLFRAGAMGGGDLVGGMDLGSLITSIGGGVVGGGVLANLAGVLLKKK